MTMIEADLQDRRALVTGAAQGLGFHTALGLARLGARVIVVDRNIAGGDAAVRQIRSLVPGAQAEFRALDLGSLAAIRSFAESLVSENSPLDILVNNAGLLPPLQRAATADGFELGFGISVLGHYALTALLLPSLARARSPRVVTVSSIAHASGVISFDDPRLERNYDPTRAYASAKLGALLFALELDRRAAKAGSSLVSAAAHPGISRTSIGDSWKKDQPRTLRERAGALALAFAMRWLSQGPEAGALPLVQAAAAPDVRGGDFYGPSGFGQFRGSPKHVQPAPRALDETTAARLWALCENLTGARFQFDARWS